MTHPLSHDLFLDPEVRWSMLQHDEQLLLHQLCWLLRGSTAPAVIPAQERLGRSPGTMMATPTTRASPTPGVVREPALTIALLGQSIGYDLINLSNCH